jgi:hypothetical protein
LAFLAILVRCFDQHIHLFCVHLRTSEEVFMFVANSRQAWRIATFCLMLSPVFAWADAFGIANVTFQWTDRNGGVHPLRSTWTTGVEVDLLGTEPAGTGFTSSATGISSFSGSDLIPFDSQTEFRGTVQSFLGAGATSYAQIQDAGGTVYSKVWPATGTFDVPDPPGNKSFTYTVDNTDYAGTALGVMQAVKFMRDYYVGKGLTFPNLTIKYDATTTNGSFYDETTSTMTLNPKAWASWDTILHETGHHIAFHNNLDGTYGGPHNFGSQNINPADPAPGARLSYGEGVATFLELMAVKDGNLNASIPGLPAKDVNSDYDTFNTPVTATTQNDADNVGFRVSAENNGTEVGANGPVRGEGDEMSTLRVLWDVYDSDSDGYTVGSDKLNWGSVETLKLMKGADTFKDFWDNLATSALADPTKLGLAVDAYKYEILGTLGETLQEYNIAGAPITDGKVVARPLLEFAEGNDDRSTKLKFVIIDELKSLIVASSDPITDTIGVTNHTWRPDQPLTPGKYYWAALNSAAQLGFAAPGTDEGWYWSSLRELTVIPETSTVVMTGMGGVFFVIGAIRRRSKTC